MSLTGITLGPGISVGGGINIGAGGSSPPGPSGSNGIVGFTEMTSGGTQNQWIEDPTATMLSNGFILNAVSGTSNIKNGVAFNYLTANNLAFFSTYGTGNKTVTWAAGSTYTGPMTVNVTNNGGGGPEFVFYMNNVTTFPSTFIFPATFS